MRWEDIFVKWKGFSWRTFASQKVERSMMKNEFVAFALQDASPNKRQLKTMMKIVESLDAKRPRPEPEPILARDLRWSP